MKQEITVSGFRDAFRDCGREDQFSYEALGLLYEYLDECEVDLDVIAVCCEFAESSPAEIASDYSIDIDGLDEDETEAAVLAHLNNRTSVVGSSINGIVYQQF